MTTKAERLARALIEMRVVYSDADFKQAEELIRSGSYLENLYKVIETTARLPTPKLKKTPLNKRKSPLSPKEQLLEKLQNRVAGNNSLLVFLDRYLSRELISDSAANRAFSHLLGIEISKKGPSRLYLADQYVETMIRMSAEERQHALDQAERLSKQESSLQLWSDVINRRGG